MAMCRDEVLQQILTDTLRSPGAPTPSRRQAINMLLLWSRELVKYMEPSLACRESHYQNFAG